MKNLLIVLTMMAFFWVSIEARASYVEICSNSAEQVSPAASGDMLVWIDYRNDPNNGDIYGRYAGGEEFPICTDSNDQREVAVSGHIVFYLSYDPLNCRWSIHGYNSRNKVRFPICLNGAEKCRIVTSGNIVAWMDHRNGNWDIYGYDLQSYDLGIKGEFPVCTDDKDQSDLAISGHILIYVTHNRNGNGAIYICDLRTKAEFPIRFVTGKSWPAINGNILVYTSNRNGSWDIYAYDWFFNEEFLIYTVIEEPSELTISNNIIAWQNNYCNGRKSICATDFISGEKFSIVDSKGLYGGFTVSGNFIAWADYGDIFGLELTRLSEHR